MQPLLYAPTGKREEKEKRKCGGKRNEYGQNKEEKVKRVGMEKEKKKIERK